MRTLAKVSSVHGESSGVGNFSSKEVPREAPAGPVEKNVCSLRHGLKKQDPENNPNVNRKRKNKMGLTIL